MASCVSLELGLPPSGEVNMDDDNTEPGDITIELESEMTVENEDGYAVAVDISGPPVKREKPDEDSSCSAETSIDSECQASSISAKRLLQAVVRREPFLNDHTWEDEVEADQGMQPAMTGAKRRPNFTHGELDALVQHMDSVIQLQQQGATWLQLQEAWDNAARHVNSVGHHRRSSREIKAKWRDLKSKVKCKAVSRTSGRRNHSVTLSSLEKKVLSVLNKSRNIVSSPATSAPLRIASKVLQQPKPKAEEQVALPPQTIIIETSRRDPLLLQRKPCAETNSNSSPREWQGWEAQTAERNAELLSRRATVPGQAAELAELSAEVAETGVWLATKRNEIAERSLALEERRTLIWEQLVQLLDNGSS